MFIGEHIAKLDSRNRVLFPSGLKKQLEGNESKNFVLKRDLFEKCLVLYPKNEWERQASILNSELNPYNRQHSSFMRYFFSNTAEVVLDANNRLLIPKRFTDEIGAEKDLVFAGLDSKIEIWALSEWNSLQPPEDFGSLAESLLGQSENLFGKK